MPIGNENAAMPTTKMEIGSVARPCRGASILPMTAPVAQITVQFAPASACAIASLATLPGIPARSFAPERKRLGPVSMVQLLATPSIPCGGLPRVDFGSDISEART